MAIKPHHIIEYQEHAGPTMIQFPPKMDENWL